MPKCKLNIKLEGHRRYYRVGDKISGQVEVLADKECPCHELFIEKSWQTHGKGGQDTSQAQRIVLHQGTWTQGLHRYDFEYDIEAEPLSYQGKYVNIDWYLNAHADISNVTGSPSKINPRAKIDFIVTTKPNGSLSPPVDVDTPEPELTESSAIHHYIPLLVLTLFAIPGYIIYKGLTEENTTFTVLGLALLCIQIPLCWRAIKPIFFEHKLGAVKLLVDRTHYAPEEIVGIRVYFTPKQNITIDYADVKLVMTETAAKGNGKKSIHHTHIHCHGEEILTGERVLAKGKPFDQSAQLRLPYKAMHSFTSDHNSLTWAIVLTINIHNVPAFQRSVPIHLHNA